MDKNTYETFLNKISVLHLASEYHFESQPMNTDLLRPTTLIPNTITPTPVSNTPDKEHSTPDNTLSSSSKLLPSNHVPTSRECTLPSIHLPLFKHDNSVSETTLSWLQAQLHPTNVTSQSATTTIAEPTPTSINTSSQLIIYSDSDNEDYDTCSRYRRKARFSAKNY